MHCPVACRCRAQLPAGAEHSCLWVQSTAVCRCRAQLSVGAEHSCLWASAAAWLSKLHLHHHLPPHFQGIPLSLMWDLAKEKVICSHTKNRDVGQPIMMPKHNKTGYDYHLMAKLYQVALYKKVSPAKPSSSIGINPHLPWQCLISGCRIEMGMRKDKWNLNTHWVCWGAGSHLLLRWSNLAESKFWQLTENFNRYGLFFNKKLPKEK